MNVSVQKMLFTPADIKSGQRTAQSHKSDTIARNRMFTFLLFTAQERVWKPKKNNDV